MHRSIIAAAVLSLSTLAGCGASPAPDGAAEVQGLALDVRDAHHVAGRFAKDGVVLAFDFARQDGRREAALRTGAGEPLLASTLSADGIETLHILGERVTVSGAPTSKDPHVEGDEKAFAELNAAPEMKLVDAARAALVKAGIDRELVSPATPTLRTKGAMNTWYQLSCYQADTFATWSFWYPTNLYIYNPSASNAWFEFRSGPLFYSFEYNVLPPRTSNDFARSYWGYPVRITNTCGSYPAMTTIWVDVY